MLVGVGIVSAVREGMNETTTTEQAVSGIEAAVNGFAGDFYYKPEAVPVSFAWSDIAAVCKQTVYCDFTTRIFVRLVDGRTVFVNASKQSKALKARLYKITRAIPYSHAPTRTSPVVQDWSGAL
jgi:hypothetical protein